MPTGMCDWHSSPEAQLPGKVRDPPPLHMLQALPMHSASYVSYFLNSHEDVDQGVPDQKTADPFFSTRVDLPCCGSQIINISFFHSLACWCRCTKAGGWQAPGKADAWVPPGAGHAVFDGLRIFLAGDTAALEPLRMLLPFAGELFAS